MFGGKVLNYINSAPYIIQTPSFCAQCDLILTFRCSYRVFRNTPENLSEIPPMRDLIVQNLLLKQNADNLKIMINLMICDKIQISSNVILSTPCFEHVNHNYKNEVEECFHIRYFIRISHNLNA